MRLDYSSPIRPLKASRRFSTYDRAHPCFRVVMLSSAVLCVLLSECFVVPYANKVAVCSGNKSPGASPFYVDLTTSSLCYLALAHCPIMSSGCPQGHRTGNQLKGAGRNHARTWLCRTQLDCIPPRSSRLGASGLMHPCSPAHAAGTDHAHSAIRGPRNKKLRPFKAHAPMAVDCFAVIG